MYVFYEETVIKKCEINVDLGELLEFKTIEDYINYKRQFKRDYDVYDEEVSEPTNIEVSKLNDFDKAILDECLEENNLSMEEYEEFINATIWDYRGLYGIR